jgi:SAM-dependent methyltransferase
VTDAGEENTRGGRACAGFPAVEADPGPAWYEHWFDRDEYELVYQARDERDARAVAELFEQAVRPERGARLLDMACGRGRHAIVLAQRGYRVTGIDLSRRSLQYARKRAAQEGLDIQFLEGDMRHVMFHHEFDAVVNLFTSFGYFDDDGDHLKAIQSMAEALRPEGFLFQDFMCKTCRICALRVLLAIAEHSHARRNQPSFIQRIFLCL